MATEAHAARGRPAAGRGGRPRAAARDRRGPRPRGPAWRPRPGWPGPTARSSPGCRGRRRRPDHDLRDRPRRDGPGPRHRGLLDLRAPPGAVPRGGPRRLHPRQGRPGHRAVQAGPAGRRVRPAPAGAGAAHHPGRRRARAPTSAPGASSSSSSASTCACRCAASASPGSRTITSAVRGQLRDPATRAEAMACCWVASGERTRTRAPHHARKLPGILTASQGAAAARPSPTSSAWSTC